MNTDPLVIRAPRRRLLTCAGSFLRYVAYSYCFYVLYAMYHLLLCFAEAFRLGHPFTTSIVFHERMSQGASTAFVEQYDDMNFTPPYLSTITARTLLIFGDRDPFYPVSIALDMHKAIARSSLWIVPNGGHVPDLNAPFVPSLLPFVRGEWKRE